MENEKENWTIPVDGVINVPDHLDKLFNRLGTQLRFHTISGKGEAETVASMTKIADDHASLQCAEMKEENGRLKASNERFVKAISELAYLIERIKNG